MLWNRTPFLSWEIYVILGSFSTLDVDEAIGVISVGTLCCNCFFNKIYIHGNITSIWKLSVKKKTKTKDRFQKYITPFKIIRFLQRKVNVLPHKIVMQHWKAHSSFVAWPIKFYTIKIKSCNLQHTSEFPVTLWKLRYGNAVIVK